MDTIKNTIGYYRDCYKEDSADLNLWNLLKTKQQDYLLLSGQDDLGVGTFSRLPIDPNFAKHMLNEVDVYQREKALLYTSFFVVGNCEIKGEKRTICSPLIFNEATIEFDEEQDYYFSVTNQSHDINEKLLQYLIPEDNQQSTPLTNSTPHDASKWVSYLNNSHCEMHSLELLKFPQLYTQKEITNALKSNTLHVLPISMLILINKARSSRGTLHELDEIIKSNQLSSPLKSLLIANKKDNNRTVNLKYNFLPGLLSTPQKELLSIAANYSLGCASGPPGTGKSYSIAAISAEHMARKESVLIVASNDSALNVIADKLSQNFGLEDVVIRAGQKEFLKQLKDYIGDLLAGYYQQDNLLNPIQTETELSVLNKKLDRLETKFISFCKSAIKRGQRLHSLQESNSKLFLKIYLTFTSGKMRQLAAQWQALESITSSQTQRELLATNYLLALKDTNLNELMGNHRQSLQAFNKALRSRTSKRQLEFFDSIDYNILLDAFPIWLVSLNSLHKVLPLKKEMFDLVIVDEATQCNISSCIPAFYRAKRAIVIGDTKQLRHYSFLAKKKEKEILYTNQLTGNEAAIVSYRNNSILDLSLQLLHSNNALTFLDEHYRSKPQLIDFSNQQFYQGKLRVMQHRPCTTDGYLHLVKTVGSRDKKGVNRTEAQAVITALKQQIKEDSKQGLIHSIGVISPFRDQAEYLAQQINDEFSDTLIKQHKLHCATAYGFQGEERDIMLISFAVDNNAKAAISYLNKHDMFNVLITRARHKQIVFTSVEESILKNNSLLRRYLASFTSFKIQHTTNQHISVFQNDVSNQLLKLNFTIYKGYQMAGIEVDILCERDGKYLAIDLIGYPGPWKDYYEINTYKLLQRANIDVLPISYGLWQIDRQSCLDKVSQMLM